MTPARDSRLAARPVVLLTAALLCAAAAAEPPKVVETTPADGDLQVDPNLRVIRVRFDQEMSRGSYSFCGGGESFPKTRGKARWGGPRVCVLPVRLEPDHEYALSINCPAARNFTNVDGEPAEICPLRFRTRPADGPVKPRDVAEENRDAVQELRQLVEEDYSYRDLRRVDWDKAFAEFRPHLEAARSPEQFAELAGKLLAKAEDIHIWLKVDERTFASHSRAVPANANARTLRRLVPNWQQRNQQVASGRYEDGIGYIVIGSWERGRADELDAAFEALADLKDAPALIVDVRFNSGGDERLAQKFAGCFIDKPVVYAYSVSRDPDSADGFSDPTARTLEPTKARPAYRGKVAVLMGRYNMSSCEAFLLMMKQVPGCKLIGERSYGSSGNPRAHELPNGVTVFLPSWKAMTADKRPFEGEGIKPDVPVKAGSEDFERGDPVLEAALKWLRQR
jgi:hypothetical protein